MTKSAVESDIFDEKTGDAAKMMMRIILCVGAVVALLLTGVPSAKEAFAANKNKMVPYFADNGLSNAVAIVQHPAGVFYEGTTYVAYQGPLEDPYVASYNHETKEWAGPYKAGISAMGKDPNRKKKYDNHGKPSIIIDDEGYIHIFFGGHGGLPEVHGPNPLGNHHYGENKHVVSKRPQDISEWEELDTIPPFGTYNQVIKLDNGDIYLFYRHGAHRSDWVYHVSKDNGRTFSPAVSFLKHKRRDDVAGVDSWYPWIGHGHGDDIIVSFDYHLCWDRDARPRGHTANREDVYFMIFDTESGKWRNITGDAIEMPLTREQAREKALVTDTGPLWTFNGAANLDPDGNPHILMTMGKDQGKITGGAKNPRHIRWNGEQWVGGTSIGPLGAKGDLEVHSSTELSVYTGYRNKEGHGIISRWDSSDAGLSFQETEVFLKRKKAGFAISSLIENPHPDARMIVAEAPDGTPNRRMYLIGDNGPIERPKHEASVLNP